MATQKLKKTQQEIEIVAEAIKKIEEWMFNESYFNKFFSFNQS